MTKDLEVHSNPNPEQFQEQVARSIVDIYVSGQHERNAFLARGHEARAYVTANSTANTPVGALPWKNNTTIPKLTQITDNLCAYYMAALIPSDDWFIWEGSNVESTAKAAVIEEYMRAKLKSSGFRNELAKCVRDWVVFGNCFAGVTWVDKTRSNPATGESISSYTGPKMYRISPKEALINPKAASIEKSFFIKREVIHISDILTDRSFDKEKLEKLLEMRSAVSYDEVATRYEEASLRIDGFNTIHDYLNSGSVEIIEYWGDIYIPDQKKTMKNMQVVVADRRFVLLQRNNPSISGRKPFSHSGWRLLPDNLYAQSPLDQLVGMQYRCDHLENLKADAFDQIIHPVIKVKGDTVEDFQFGPNQKIYCGAEGDVEFMRPDASVLQCNNEISTYHQLMEYMAGSPRETMGFRTPGEKTAFEVDQLTKAADRMFLDKVNQFEDFIEDILNVMFELLMINLNFNDVIRVLADDQKTAIFKTITKEDVVATGALRPVGAKHYADRSKRLQELAQLQNMVKTLPSMAIHISSERTARMLSEELGYDKWKIVEPYIGIDEQVQAQIHAQLAQQHAQAALGQQGGMIQNGQEGGTGSPLGVNTGGEGGIPTVNQQNQ